MNPQRDYRHRIDLSIEECGLIAEAMAFFQAHGYPCQTNWRVVHRPPMERLQTRALAECPLLGRTGYAEMAGMT